MASTQAKHSIVSSVYILDVADAPKLWGLSPAERLQRALPKMGAENIHLITAEDAKNLHPTDNDTPALILRGDIAYDKPILQGLLEAENTYIVDNDGLRTAVCVSIKDISAAIDWLNGTGDAPSSAKTCLPTEIGGAYHAMLRKREDPYCLHVTDKNLGDSEKIVFMGAYKGVTDLVTKYLWPRPAMVVTKLCVKFGFSPNAVTWVGAALMMVALYFFWQGQYGIGLLCGWIMTFLDTVDGKLARVTFTSSSFGNILDHGIDLIHPPFWYLAWAIGLTAYGLPLSEALYDTVIWTIFGSYIAGRIVEGYFMRRFGFHIHVWRKFDSFFRLILARRNPNMIILTLFWALGRPDIGLLLITAWHVVTLAVHIVQSIQAEIDLARKIKIVSWLEQKPQAEAA